MKLERIVRCQSSQGKQVSPPTLCQWDPIDTCTKGAKGANAILGSKVGRSPGRLVKCQYMDFTFSCRLAQQIVVALQWPTLGWISQVVTDPEDPHDLI